MAKKERATRQGRGRKPAPKVNVAAAKDIEEVGGGMSLDDGIVVATTIALAFAVILVMLVN